MLPFTTESLLISIIPFPDLKITSPEITVLSKISVCSFPLRPFTVRLLSLLSDKTNMTRMYF